MDREFFYAMMARCSDRLHRISLPLYIVLRDGEGPQPLATGFLLEHADHLFLISAGHTFGLSDSERRTSSIFAARADERSALAQMAGRIIDSRGDIDVGVLDLDPRSVALVREFPRLSPLDLDPSERCGWHLMLGHPGELRPESEAFQSPDGTVTHVGMPAYLGLWTSDIDRESLDRCEPWHLLLRLDRDELGSGHRVPESLGGVSGAPVWFAFRGDGDEVTWSDDALKVVGVQTAVYVQGSLQTIRATPIAAAMFMIDRYLAGDYGSVLQTHGSP